MPASKSQDTCRQWLSQLGVQDGFVGRHDQAPDIKECLMSLEEGLQRLEKDVSSRLLRLMEEVKTDFIKQGQTITDARTNLQLIFEQLTQAPRNATANKRAAYALDQQVNFLSRRVRPRMLRALEKLSPKYQLLEKPLKELNNFRHHTAKPLPDYLSLLRARNKHTALAEGVSIFELEFLPQLDRLCRLPFISTFRFTMLRWRCRQRYSFYPLPLKAIALDCLITRSDLKPMQLIQRHQATHDELQGRLADAWRSIRFNMETSATELDDVCDTLRSGRSETLEDRSAEISSIVFGAMDKCLETFDDVSVTYASFVEGVIAEISQDHKNALAAIREGIDGSRFLGARLRWTLRSLLKEWHKRIDSLKETVMNNFSLNKETPRRVSRGTRWLVTLFGIFRDQQPVEESLLQLTDLPTESELLEQSKVLPPIYRRLFHNEPLANREFLVGMEEELSLLAETYQRWQSGRASSVGVIGPEGSGKTSLLNCFEGELDENTKVARAELVYRIRTSGDVLRMLEDILELEEACESPAQLISKIHGMERQVIIIENGHQLFLRTVGGREAVDTFFYIMMNTRNNLFWLLSFRLHPWMRMGYMHQIERFFTRVVKSEFHTAQELKTAILLRQRATGQEPLFSEVGVGSYRLRKLLLQHNAQDAPVQQVLMDMYFNNLFELTGGNMETTLYYWLRSLAVDEQGRVKVQACVKVDHGFIKKLDTLNLLTLAEVLAHGGLTPLEHGDIFNMEQSRSRLVLDYLRQIRLLKGHNNDKYGQPVYYSINTLFYQPIHSALDAMHIIY